MDAEIVRLVLFVAEHAGIRPAQLAEEFGVSSRTVRNHVRSANQALVGVAHLDLPRGGGYALVVDDAAAFDAWLAQAKAARRSLPQTPESRVTYLLNDLLSRSDYITIDTLSSILYVSRASISNDLKQVEARLSRFGLTLDKRSHHGIKVVGPEMARRLCLASVAMDASGSAQVAPGLPIDPDDQRLLLDAVSSCVERVTSEERFSVNSVAYRNLITHIAIALMRIQANCYVPMETEQLASIKRSGVFPVAERVAREINDATGIRLPEEEVAYIAIHLSGKQLLEDASADESGLVITDEVWDVVLRMVEAVRETFRFDLRNDLELRMNLARHLVPLSVRLRYHLSLDNPILPEIKSRFSLAYSMAVEASSVLTEKYGSPLSEDEIGYIALAFALALERQKTELPKKNILVVCATGAGSARLLEYRYRQEFGAYVDSIRTCDAAHVRYVDFTDIDYVFTTVPLSERLPVPVREVGYFLDASEVESVRELLSGGGARPASALGMFRPELFFDHLRASTRDEVIDALCERVARLEEVSPDFADLVRRREEASPTAFGNRVAAPHPLEAASARSFVATALLDEPVRWGEQDVQVVFLLAISRDGDDVPEGFYECMASLVLSEPAVDELLAARSWEALARLLADPAGP